MHLRLFVERLDSRARVGRLEIPGVPQPLRTLERPWRENHRNISAVPYGVYDLLAAGNIGASGFSWYLRSWCVTVRADKAAAWQRWGCRLGDVANFPDELAGCVALGLAPWKGYGFDSSRGPAVESSTEAREVLDAALSMDGGLATEPDKATPWHSLAIVPDPGVVF